MKEMLEYLVSQTQRMNHEQSSIVHRCARMPEEKILPFEKDRLTTIYMWLHMASGSIAKRRFARKN